jgi:ABC-2 type transport system permease protein
MSELASESLKLNVTIVSLTARALLGRRRVWLLLPMPVLLIGLTVIGRVSGQPITDWGPAVFGQLGFAVVLPLTALIVGSSVLGLEIEDGTITHLLTKPLPRKEIILAKLAVATAVGVVSVAIPLAIAGAIAGSAQLAVGVGIGAALGAFAYTAVFLALSLATRRPVAVGLVYIILWENLLTRFIDGAKVLSIREYAASLAEAMGSSGWLPSHVAVAAAVIMGVVVTVAGTVLATVRLRSFSLAGETS